MAPGGTKQVKLTLSSLIWSGNKLGFSFLSTLITIYKCAQNVPVPAGRQTQIATAAATGAEESDMHFGGGGTLSQA